MNAWESPTMVCPTAEIFHSPSRGWRALRAGPSHMSIATSQELVDFFSANDISIGEEKKKKKKAGVKSKAQHRTARAAERVAKNLMKQADDSSDKQLSFCELLGFFYPNISQAALQRFIDQYEDESNPIHGKHLSCEAIEAVFNKYDTDGSASLSIGELEQGLVTNGLEEVWKKYSGVFARYDLDGNEEFSLEEFVMLMAILDSCVIN